MNDLLLSFFESFTTTTVTDDNTVIATTDDYVVIVKNIPSDEISSHYQGRSDVQRVSPVFKSGTLEIDPEGSLLAFATWTQEECRLFEIGQYTEDDCFVPTVSIEVRTPEEFVFISASETFGRELLSKMKSFCAEHPDYVAAAVDISEKNLGRNQLVAFYEKQISIQIPHERKHDANWLGIIHLDLENETFDFDFYDEVDGEHFTIVEIWDELDLELAEFVVDALIENPVLPRNKDGILY